MNIKLVATSLFTLSALFTANTYAADSTQKAFEAIKAEYEKSLESAAKSSNIRSGLIKACGVKYKMAISNKTLSQSEVNKLCACSVDAEGQVTNAQTWELQSAVNAKNKTKYQQLQMALLKKQGESIKKCVGSSLDQKLSKLASQAMVPAKK